MTDGMKPGTALVTGSAKRIGHAIAVDLAAQGWAVGVHYRGSRSAAEAVVAEIKAGGGRAIALQADLTDHIALPSLVAACADALGPVTLLINNASVFEPDGIGALEDSVWDQHMGIHLRAPVTLTDAMVAALPENENGVVINMIDQRVWRLTPHFLSYTLSKSALWTATQTLAQALAPRIRVCAIGPGPTLANDRQAPEDFANQTRLVPLQRGPTLDEISAAIRFILASPSLTGQMIALDGGQHLAWQTPDVLGANE